MFFLRLEQQNVDTSRTCASTSAITSAISGMGVGMGSFDYQKVTFKIITDLKVFVVSHLH